DDVAATLKHRGLDLVADDKAIEWLLEKAGHDVHSGARPLRRTIQRHVEDAVSELLIASREPLESVEVTVVDDVLKVQPVQPVQASSPEPVGLVR
ncbi:MAG TPA: hypothetical protein VGR00_12205, partial [Thermoanaerobaculia bacterium]|nr:hypothetical protein [Thermoanaerobaculia bacterium]